MHAGLERESARDVVAIADSLTETIMKLAVAALAFLLTAGAAFAHHSPIVFDRTRQVTLTGVVTEFRWGNPHSWIHIDVAEGDGKVANWSIEMNPASHLAREGWRSSTLKTGDKITVVVYPLRNDEKGGQYISVTLPDGKKLGERPDGVI
jgi:hypothetical protein